MLLARDGWSAPFFDCNHAIVYVYIHGRYCAHTECGGNGRAIFNLEKKGAQKKKKKPYGRIMTCIANIIGKHFERFSYCIDNYSCVNSCALCKKLSEIRGNKMRQQQQQCRYMPLIIMIFLF